MSISRIKKIAAATFVLIALQVRAASAAVLVIGGGGELLGANDVDVGGALYDVSLTKGLCSDVFSGCDEQSDFTFTSSAEALVAADALLSQVFVGEFDTNPSSITGCETASPASVLDFCAGLIPFIDPVLGQFLYIIKNSFDESFDGVSLGGLSPGIGAGSVANWVVFTPNEVSEIPLPAAAPLFFAGLAGLGFAARRRKTT